MAYTRDYFRKMNYIVYTVLAQSDPVYDGAPVWLPIDPFLLLLLKFFVVVTCVFFWVKFLYDFLMQGHRLRHHRHDRG